MGTRICIVMNLVKTKTLRNEHRRYKESAQQGGSRIPF